MRFLMLMFVIWAAQAHSGSGEVSAPDPNAPVVEAQMPLRILRDAGQPPRMGPVALKAGTYEETSPFNISFDFNSEGATLGSPRGVGMTVRFGDYCRDRHSWVEAVLISSTGQRWSGHRVVVPAGPDRAQDWSSGYVDGPQVQKAVAAGGRFTLALQDDEGQLWHQVGIDTLTPAARQRLFAANLATFRATDPAAVPVASDMLIAVQGEPVRLPWPSRPCPTA